MRQKGTIRQKSLFFMVFALAVPVICFTVIAQAQIWKSSEEALNERVENTTKWMNSMLSMVMEQYSEALYEFCTDDEVVLLAENINQDRDVLDTSTSRLRQRLNGLCSANDGVEGITLITAGGEKLYYDRIMTSSVSSQWAGQVEAPEIAYGADYCGFGPMIQTENGEIHTYQISRKLIDYHDIHKEIGTVVMTIDLGTLDHVLDLNDASEAYLCQDGIILAAKEESQIGKPVSSIPLGTRWLRTAVNEKSGWEIYNYYSASVYMMTLWSQTALWTISAALTVIGVIGAVWYAVNPVLYHVEGLMRAMNQVEAGDFNVRVSYRTRVPREVQQIVTGFNKMTEQLGRMVEQVKQSAIDQKNAEISAMEAQIDPHFLYNTLDTINWKAIEKEEYEISDMLGALADILRYSIRNPGETVSIGQVMYWMERYTRLQQGRLEAPLVVEMDVPEYLKNYRIHKLILQPFVENAICHGLWRKKDECRLRLSIRMAEEQLHIVVEDNGEGIEPEILEYLNSDRTDFPGHVGMSNVKTRLKLYYGDDASMFFESKMGCYTKAHLFINAIGEEEPSENSNCGG